MKKRILIIVYVLLLCGTVTFAWLSNAQENINETIDVDFRDGKAVITGFAFDAYLERKLDDGEVNANDVDNDGYVSVEADREDGEPFAFDSNKTLPGERIPFRIRAKNLGDAEKKTKLFLDMQIDGYDPDAEDVNVLDVLYVEIVLGDGFAESGTKHAFKKLSDAVYRGNGIFSLEIYGEGEEIAVPTVETVNTRLGKLGKETNGYVALNCSFYYDQSATAAYQGKGISALSFRLEQ